MSAKFNNTIEMALPSDGVMVVGSDNLIHRDYFDYLAEKRPDFVDLGWCYYYEQATGKMLWHYQAVLGAGKYMSRTILERASWRPYEENQNRNVDGGPKKYVYEGEGVYLQEPWAIDIKTPDENMWDFSVIEGRYRNTQEVDAKLIFASFGLIDSDWAI